MSRYQFSVSFQCNGSRKTSQIAHEYLCGGLLEGRLLTRFAVGYRGPFSGQFFSDPGWDPKELVMCANQSRLYFFGAVTAATALACGVFAGPGLANAVPPKTDQQAAPASSVVPGGSSQSETQTTSRAAPAMAASLTPARPSPGLEVGVTMLVGGQASAGARTSATAPSSTSTASAPTNPSPADPLRGDGVAAQLSRATAVGDASVSDTTGCHETCLGEARHAGAPGNTIDDTTRRGAAVRGKGRCTAAVRHTSIRARASRDFTADDCGYRDAASRGSAQRDAPRRDTTRRDTICRDAASPGSDSSAVHGHRRVRSAPTSVVGDALAMGRSAPGSAPRSDAWLVPFGRAYSSLARDGPGTARAGDAIAGRPCRFR